MLTLIRMVKMNKHYMDYQNVYRGNWWLTEAVKTITIHQIINPKDGENKKIKSDRKRKGSDIVGCGSIQ